jgi:hypothetical protein
MPTYWSWKSGRDIYEHNLSHEPIVTNLGFLLQPFDNMAHSINNHFLHLFQAEQRSKTLHTRFILCFFKKKTISHYTIIISSISACPTPLRWACTRIKLKLMHTKINIYQHISNGDYATLLQLSSTSTQQ